LPIFRFAGRFINDRQNDKYMAFPQADLEMRYGFIATFIRRECDPAVIRRIDSPAHMFRYMRKKFIPGFPGEICGKVLAQSFEFWPHMSGQSFHARLEAWSFEYFKVLFSPEWFHGHPLLK